MSQTVPQEVNLATFVEVLKRSQIVDEDRLRRTLKATLLSSEEDKPSAEQVASNLVTAGVITEWQANKLLKGKYKGFYLGKYIIRRPLGQGGMGVVYEAEHSVLNTQVAIKLLPKDKNDVKRSVSRFMAEARAAAKLDHPNLTRVHDCDVIDDRRFMVMELIRGTDLGELVSRNGPLQVPLAISLLKQAAAGLEHAHQNGVIHRDVKPQNFLVDAEGHLKVTDLGLALFQVDTPERMTRDGENNVVGTVDFVAPEQAWESTSVDRRADIYALGCTLYFMLVGEPPFGSGTLAQRIAKHQTAVAPLISQQRADVPPALEKLYRRMMEKKPQDRPQHMASVVDACEQIERQLPSSKSTTAVPNFSVEHQRQQSPEERERWNSSEFLGLNGSDSIDVAAAARAQLDTNAEPKFSEDTVPMGPADPLADLPDQFPATDTAGSGAAAGSSRPAYWQPNQPARKKSSKASSIQDMAERSELVWLFSNKYFWIGLGLVISCASIGMTLWSMGTSNTISPVKMIKANE